MTCAHHDGRAEIRIAMSSHGKPVVRTAQSRAALWVSILVSTLNQLCMATMAAFFAPVAMATWNATAFQIGLIIASHPVATMLFAPVVPNLFRWAVLRL